MPLFSAFASVLLSLPLPSATPVAAVPAPEVQVPFGCGLVFPVSQGHDVGSHTYNDVWAWDFRMPEGIPIVAAADGVVRMARGDSTQGGCDPAFASYANYVVVTHANGYETQYLHFSQVVVKPGDKVKAGDLLGYSGKTGWACGSHLHFKVAKPEGTGWNNPSVPARIAGYGDPTIDTVIASPACTLQHKAPDIQMAKADQKSPPLAVVPTSATAPAQGASAPAASPAQVAPPSVKPSADETPVPKPDSTPPVQDAPPKAATAT